MQRVPPSTIIWFPILFALYACASTVPHTPGDAKPIIIAAEKSEKPVPVVAAGSETPKPPLPGGEAAMPIEAKKEIPAPVAADDGKRLPLMPGDEKPVPHIALLLPLKSAVFGSAADTVRQGFQAAAILERQGLPVRIYGCFDESKDITALYHQAIDQGALAVVGPLTRSGASTLAAEQNFPVPTLALNAMEGQSVKQLYFFGMAAEAEARQVAHLAKQQGLHQIIVITTTTQLSQRLRSAFEEEWNSLGGVILHEFEFNDDPTALADITDIPDTAIFLAAEAEKARLIRPYLLNKLPIYATSQIFVGNDDSLTNYDLNGIRFVDMPWLLQADHPAVMTYPRANPPLSADRERLYALGIDAFRLIQLLLANQTNTALPLDGVSGDIQLHGHVFQRTAILAVFAQGRAQPQSTHAFSAIPVFTDHVISRP